MTQESKPTDHPLSERDRWQEMREIHREYRNFYQLFGGAVIVLILTGVGISLFASDLLGYWANFYVTLIGTALTVFVIDRRAGQRATKERKEELMMQMSSQHNPFAREAVRILMLKGWLYDGTLNHGNFGVADLTRAELHGAQMQYVRLEGATLNGATLDEANLEHADLNYAKANGADLWDTKLRYATLRQVEFEHAELHRTDLRDTDLRFARFNRAEVYGTDFRGANLQHAQLAGADFNDEVVFDEKTIMPDGSYWHRGLDISVYLQEITDESNTEKHDI